MKLSSGGQGAAAVLTDLYLAAMASVFLLFPGFHGYTEMTEDKFLLLCWLTGGYVVLSLLLPLELWLVGGRRPESFGTMLKKTGWTQRLMALYLLWAVLSALCSVDPAQSFWGGPRREGLLSLLLYGEAFLLVSCNARVKKWHLGLFALSVSLNCVVALVQLAGYNPFGLYPAGMNFYDGNVRYAGQFLGTLGNVGLMTAVLCIAIPVFWTAMLRMRGKERFALLIPLGLSLAALFGSKVEAGIVGVFGAALLTVPVVVPEKGRNRRMLAAASGAVIVLGLAVVYLFGEQLPGFLYEANRVMHAQAEDTFGSGRIYIWRSVLPLIQERPVFGGGPETLGLRGDIQFERFSEELGIMLRSYVDTAHNEYLNIAVELGIPALVFYLGSLICGAVFWVKKSPESSAAAICGAGVMGYCVQAFFGISSVVSAPFFWLTLGLLVSAGREAVQPTAPEKKGKRRA